MSAYKTLLLFGPHLRGQGMVAAGKGCQHGSSQSMLGNIANRYYSAEVHSDVNLRPTVAVGTMPIYKDNLKNLVEPLLLGNIEKTND